MLPSDVSDHRPFRHASMTAAAVAVLGITACGTTPGVTPTLTPISTAAGGTAAAASATASATAAPTETSAAATDAATSTPPASGSVTWEGLIFDRPESPAGMAAITRGGPGLVAVGNSGGQGAAWTLARGEAWRPASVPSPDPDARDDEIVSMVDVAEAPFGLAAIGIVGIPNSEPFESVFWSSEDGTAWTEVARAPVLLNALAAGGEGMIAVGGTGPAVGSPHGVSIWTTRDGERWSEVPDTDALGASELTDVVQRGSGFAGVGFGRAGADDLLQAVTYSSPDGLRWTRSPAPGSEETVMRALSVAGVGYVAVGEHRAAGRSKPALWRSTDGSVWQRVPIDLTPGSMSAVTATPSGSLVAVGHADGPPTLLALWTSTDGLTWTFQSGVSEEGSGYLNDVVIFDGEVVAGGTVSVDPEASQPIVITGPPPPD